MNYLSALIDTPIIPLRPEITELFQDYFRLLIKMKRMGAKPNKELISTMLLTILHGVGSIHQNTNVTTRTFNRGEEIVKRLVQYIIKHYTKERSVAFMPTCFIYPLSTSALLSIRLREKLLQISSPN